MAHKPDNQTLLQVCLKQIEAGQPLEAVLAEHPEAEGLRDELAAACWLLSRQDRFAPRPRFVSASRKRLVAQVSAQESQRSRWSAGWRRLRGEWRAFSHSQMLLAAVWVLLIGMLVQSANILYRAAPTWLPGDRLYSLRSFSEQAVLVAAITPTNRTAWHIEFARRRLLEAQALALEGRYEYIPATVSDLSRHVEMSSSGIHRLARVDVVRARSLASRLQAILYGQTRVMAVLAQISPLETGRDLQRALAISQKGMSAVQDVFAPGSGSRLMRQTGLLPGSAPGQPERWAWRQEGEAPW